MTWLNPLKVYLKTEEKQLVRDLKETVLPLENIASFGIKHRPLLRDDETVKSYYPIGFVLDKQGNYYVTGFMVIQELVDTYKGKYKATKSKQTGPNQIGKKPKTATDWTYTLTA